MVYTVYKFTNSEGKSYVGMTSGTIEARLDQHMKNPSNSKLKADIARLTENGSIPYKSHFTVVALHLTEKYKEAIALEFNMIKVHGTQHPHGYNVLSGSPGLDRRWEHFKKN